MLCLILLDSFVDVGLESLPFPQRGESSQFFLGVFRFRTSHQRGESSGRKKNEIENGRIPQSMSKTLKDAKHKEKGKLF